MLDKFKNNNSSFLLLFVFFCLIFTGIYFCFINNYGWDWDTYAMINSYLNILNNGIYVRSRGAGYLVPEIGIGFLSYNFGSFFTNIVCFSFLIIGLISFYFSLEKSNSIHLKKKNLEINEIIFFLILCLSNHIVMRDGTFPMDYSWSFMFYSLGLYFFLKNKNELCVIFFSLCIGSRFNFIIFVLPTLLAFKKEKFNLKERFFIIISVVFFGSLFFVPTWLSDKFSLDFIFSKNWYNNFKPEPVFSIVELGRFIHKTISTLGILFLLTVSYLLIFSEVQLKKFKFEIIIILINLIEFFFFPWEPSFLWILIFYLNFILVKSFNRNLIYLLILINLFNWFYEIKVINILYKKDGCFNNILAAKVSPVIEKGLIFQTPSRIEDTKCYPDLLGDKTEIIKFKDKIVKGDRLK
jgi:hypothetical protein